MVSLYLTYLILSFKNNWVKLFRKLRNLFFNKRKERKQYYEITFKISCNSNLTQNKLLLILMHAKSTKINYLEPFYKGIIKKRPSSKPLPLIFFCSLYIVSWFQNKKETPNKIRLKPVKLTSSNTTTYCIQRPKVNFKMRYFLI